VIPRLDIYCHDFVVEDRGHGNRQFGAVALHARAFVRGQQVVVRAS
jgi:hypothetical protein